MLYTQGLQKGIALLLVLGLTAPPSWTSVPQGSLAVQGNTETPSFLSIEIPHDLAAVEEIYEAPPREDPRLILHIENIHGNEEAQLQIAKLLEYLTGHYGFRTIFVEGAVEPLRPDYLNLFEKDKENLAVAKFLIEKGKLTGAEYFLMKHPERAEILGMENPALYRQNLQTYRQVRASRPGVEMFLKKCEEQLSTLSSRIFSPDTRRLVSEWKRFNADRRDYLPSARHLVRDAKKFLDLDLESLFAQVEWPQLTRFLVLQTMEKDLNPERAEREKAILLEFLKQSGASSGLIQEVEKIREKELRVHRWSPGNPGENNPPRSVLEQLLEEAGPRGFEFHDYPAFSLYAGYLILQSELRVSALLEEVEILFQKILNELVVTEMEKNLWELYRDHALLEKLFDLELTRGQWHQSRYRRQWIRPESMVSRLVRMEEELGGAPRKGAREGVIETGRSEASLGAAQIQELFDAAFLFYDLTLRREQAFFRAVQKEMEPGKPGKAIVITGGFHTLGMLERFKKEAVNYGVLMPRLLARSQPGLLYETGMMGHSSTLFDVATLEILNLLQSSKSHKEMGGEVLAKLKSVLEAYIRIGKFKNVEDAVKHFNHFNRSLFAKDYSLQLEVSPENPNALWVRIGESYLSQEKEGDAHIVQIPLQTFTDYETGEPRLKLADRVETGPLLSAYVRKPPRIKRSEMAGGSGEDLTPEEDEGEEALPLPPEEPLPEATTLAGMSGEPEVREEVTALMKKSKFKLQPNNFTALSDKEGVPEPFVVAVEVLGSLLKEQDSKDQTLSDLTRLEQKLEENTEER